MTTTFKTALIAVAAIFAFTGVAQAEGVTINLAGKDAKAVHSEIVSAAYKVCRSTVADFTDYSMASESACVNDTILKFDAQYRTVSASRMAAAELSNRAGQR
jgi:hypothetical protein